MDDFLRAGERTTQNARGAPDVLSLKEKDPGQWRTSRTILLHKNSDWGSSKLSSNMPAERALNALHEDYSRSNITLDETQPAK
ncbi:unnamed protein product [Strongylus vulgaris]|uniref:Uncharacterized protein n=1 Tax=Strongylus vulgaris TaxID=40348 RepID=A0A3P7J4C2_STRVU|nr:unnamed protein product [Strongylus vulgaris]